MVVKQYIETHLERGGTVITVSLNGHGAFDSAWWPAILQGLREAKCPRNVYYLAQDYLRERKAIIKIKFTTWERTKQGAVRKVLAVAIHSGTSNMTQFLTFNIPIRTEQ